jgi:hypothetical protein
MRIKNPVDLSWFVPYQTAMAEKHTGQCYCGAVEIEMRGDPLEMGYCHCENCRHYSAAPVSAFTLWKKEDVRVTKGEEFLGRFKSSDISERGYCTKCGGHIIVEHPTLGLMDVASELSEIFRSSQRCTSITLKRFCR